MDNNIKTLRDEIAISAPSDAIPTLTNNETVIFLAEEMGILIDLENPIEMINFGMAYNAHMRYLYADAMLERRKVFPKQGEK